MRLIPLSLVALALYGESAAGIHWTAPAGWKTEGARPMRAATYTVPAAPGDTEGGECVVYFFGPGQGGSVQANIDRWKGQFNPPNGKVTRVTIHNLPVTRIDSSGAYAGMGGPMTPGPQKSGYRLLGAIVEGPAGNLFIKFTAPTKTVAANQQKFETFLNSFAKD